MLSRKRCWGCASIFVAAILCAVAGYDVTEKDEFSSPVDSLTHENELEQTEQVAPIWSDGKVSLRGLFSMQWAKQKVHVGTLEIAALALAVCYILVYVRGRRRNYQIAMSFISSVHGLFCESFLEAGPALESPPSDRRKLLARNSCSTFLYYATGRRGCNGVLVRISLANRHDLFLLLWSIFNPVHDTVTIEVSMADEDMEPLIFAVTRKREVKQIMQDIPHLQEFAGIIRNKLRPESYVCLSETSALADSLLPPPALTTISEYAELLELIHLTDHNDERIVGQRDVTKNAMRFRFRLPVVTTRSGSGKSNGRHNQRGPEALVKLALFYVNHVNRFKMPPAMKKKAVERRDEVEKRKQKLMHAQRQGKFQQLKMEKLEREREEYDQLTPEQRRRRDIKDEKKAKKAATNRKMKMKVTKM